MARRKKTQQEEQAWRSRVAGAKPPLTGNNLAYGPVTGLGDMGMHLPREQAANYIDPTSVFLHDVVNNTVSLDPARREEFARILNQAYHSLDVTPQTQLDLTELGLSSTTTVGELQKTLMDAYLPEITQFAQSIKSTRNGIGDLVSEAILQFPQTIMNWKPGEGSFLNFMQYGIRGSMTNAKRANASRLPEIPMGSWTRTRVEEPDEADIEFAAQSNFDANTVLDLLDGAGEGAWGHMTSGHPDVEAALELYYEEITGRPAKGNWKNDLYYEVLKRADGVNTVGNPVDSFNPPPSNPFYRDLAKVIDPGSTSGQAIPTSFHVPKGQSLFEYGTYGLTISDAATTRPPFVQATLRTPKQVEQAFAVLRSGESSNDPGLAMRIEGALRNAYVLRNEGSDFNNLPANWANRLVSQVKAENVRMVNGKPRYRQFEGIPVEGVFLPRDEKGRTQSLFQTYEVENASGKSASYLGINKDALTEDPYEAARVSKAELDLYGDTLDTITGFRREAKEAEEAGDVEWARTLREEADSLVDPAKARLLGKDLRTVNAGLQGRETVGGNVLGNMGSFENAIAHGKYDAEPTAYSPNELGHTEIIEGSEAHRIAPRSRVDAALEGVRDPNAREAILDRAANIARSTAEPGREYAIDDVPSRSDEPITDAELTRMQTIHEKFAGEVIEKGGKAAPGRMNHAAPEYQERDISFGSPSKPTRYAFNGRGTLEFEPVSERQTRPIQYRDANGKLKWKTVAADRQTHVGQLFTRGRVPTLDELRTAQRMDREGAPVYGPAQSRRPEGPLYRSEDRRVSDALAAMTEGDPTAAMSVAMAKATATTGRPASNFIAQWKAANPALGLEQGSQYFAGRNMVFRYRGTEAFARNNVTINPGFDPGVRSYLHEVVGAAFARKNKAHVDIGSDWDPAMEEQAYAGAYSSVPPPDIPPLEGLLDAPPAAAQSAPSVQQSGEVLSDVGMPPETVSPLVEGTAGGGQPPVTPPPTITAAPEPERRPTQSAAARTSGRPNKTVKQAVRDAKQGRRVLEMDFPDYIADHLGRGPQNKEAFEAWRSGLDERRPAFEEAFRNVMEEKWYFAPEGRSVYSDMIKTHGWKGNPAAETPPTAAARPPAVSNGQTATAPSAPGRRVSSAARKLAEEAGVNPYQVQGTGRNGNVGVEDVRRAIANGTAVPAQPSARPAHSDAGNARFVSAGEINQELDGGAYEDEFSLPPDFFNANPVAAMDQQEQVNNFLQSQLQAQVAQLRKIDHEWTRQLAEDLGVNPDGSERVLTEEERAAQNIARDIRAAERISGEGPTAQARAAHWTGRVSDAKARVASLRPMNTLKGKEHTLYGAYNEVSNSFVKHGVETITAEEINDTQKMVQGAFQSALGEDLSGLSPRELGATIEKRVREKIEGTLKEFEKSLVQEGRSPQDAEYLKKKASDVAHHMIEEGMSEVADTFGAHGYKDLKFGISARGAKGLAKYSGDVDVQSRLGELGGEAVAAEGPLKVIQVGDKALTIGASQWSGAGAAVRGGRGGGEDDPRINSIYQSNVGHFMMAQFMGSMAWKGTGGQVLDTARAWSLNQYGYVGLSGMGDNRPAGETMATARAEIAANRAGSMAYEQYGFLNEMGYAASGTVFGPGLNRLGNDLKMTVGSAALAGIGTWGAGALIGGATGAALTAAAAPVAGAAALAVGIPSVGMTMYNTLTGQDSYEGAGWKNLLSGTVLNAAEQGRNWGGWASSTGMGFFGLPKALAMMDGSYQDDYTRKYYGMEAREYVMGSFVGRALGAGTVNWLFEGRDEKSQAMQRLAGEVMEDTGLKEDAVQKGLSGMQVAFGGFETAEQRAGARYIMNRAQDLGIDSSDLITSVSSMASQRGVMMGSQEFQRMALGFSSMTFEEQQKEVIRSSRDFQKYAQWVPYLEGGNAEGYALFNQLGGTNMAQTQAIQSVLAQAQQMGVNMTPETALSLATTANKLQPYQSLETTRMAASLSQMDAGSFIGNLNNITGAVQGAAFNFSLSDAGNLASGTMTTAGYGRRADTLEFIQGVASGNAYALSDYGRMAGIGALQSMDANGLQMGLKDMSGLLLYASQNVLRQPGLTGAQTLAGLGLTFGQTDQNALLAGGLWSYQQSYVDQANAYQAQGLNMQFSQLAATRQFTYAGWGLENQMNAFQWQQQQRGFEWQNTMLDTNNRFRLEDAALTRQQRDASNENTRWTQAFDYQTSLMKRDWAREDYQYNTQMRQLSFGWNMEDLDEQIRRSSGYERAMLIKQRDRATLSENLQSGQAEKQFKRQEELWKREDERYQKGLEYQERMIELDNSRFELNQRQADEMYQLQKERLAEEEEAAGKLHELRLEMEALQRERAEEQMKFQEQSLELQRQQMLLQNEYTDNMTKLSHIQTEQEATLRKITSYSPAFSRMLTDFLAFLQEASQAQPPSNLGGNTYR